MKIIKRNGTETDFEKSKIENAIKGANKEVEGNKKLSEEEIKEIASYIEDKAVTATHNFNVEEIQDMVEDEINKRGKFELGRKYSQYRFKRASLRNHNELDDKLLSIVNYDNEEVKQENSNKNPQILSVQRDYIAGEVSRDITNRLLLDDDIVQAHKEGIIHFHDSDYFMSREHNCGLCNLQDMLDNGTVISGTMIEKPKSFSVACNVATQIIAQVSSSQFGGQSITLAHLAPYVDVSRQKIKKVLLEEFEVDSYDDLSDELKKIYDRSLDMRVKEEIKRGVQIIQYQVITLMTTNGQAPFITVFMYIDEVPEGQTRDDLVMIIEEVLNQRMQGVKNEQGVWITPAFPKLIYVLDEDNIHEDSKYYWLTTLAAKCTSKRMVPDYISAKKMKEIKGDVYTCMGCVDGNETIIISLNGGPDESEKRTFSDVWNTLSDMYDVQDQEPGSPHKFISLVSEDVWIKDPTADGGFARCLGIIRNSEQRSWKIVTFRNGRKIRCTSDHPFYIIGKGRIFASELEIGDKVYFDEEELNKNTGLVEVPIVKIDDDYTSSYSYDVTTSTDKFEVSGMVSHNCRSFLTVEDSIRNPDGSHKFYGRFNQGVVTINLVDAALSSGKSEEKFWKIMDERLELCHRALRKRHERLLGTPSDFAPIIWQHGGYARLKKGEPIDKLLYGGYSTISLGYAGLYECVYYMKGTSHTDEVAKPFALKVMQMLNDKCAEWREKENIAYSVYGTPIESTTYKFAKCLKQRFGVIEGVTDHNYITNSYHVPVTEDIDAFTKLTFESDFQVLSPGGAISYVEVPDMQNNIEAILEVMKHIYNTIVYAELNTKSDYCQVCGYDGEIKVLKDEESHKWIWKCPNCGNTDQNKMNVTRRTCGYIGSNFWNQGRTEEIANRVLHLDNMEV